MTNASGGIDNDQQTLSIDYAHNLLSISNGNSVEIPFTAPDIGVVYLTWGGENKTGSGSVIYTKSINGVVTINFEAFKEAFNTFLNFPLPENYFPDYDVYYPLITKDTFENVGVLIIRKSGKTEIKLKEGFDQKEYIYYTILDRVCTVNINFEESHNSINHLDNNPKPPTEEGSPGDSFPSVPIG